MARNHQSKKSAAEHHQMQDDKTIRLGRKHGLTELSDQQILEFSRELRGTKSKTQMVRERKRAAKLRKAGKTDRDVNFPFLKQKIKANISKLKGQIHELQESRKILVAEAKQLRDLFTVDDNDVFNFKDPFPLSLKIWSQLFKLMDNPDFSGVREWVIGEGLPQSQWCLIEGWDEAAKAGFLKRRNEISDDWDGRLQAKRIEVTAWETLNPGDEEFEPSTVEAELDVDTEMEELDRQPAITQLRGWRGELALHPKE